MRENTLVPPGNGSRSKILEVPALAERLAALRAQGLKIVLCHGVFDLLHVGHIRHLEEARSHGDVLVVTVTEDRYVNKGPHRPAFADTLRTEVLAALDVVDLVAVSRFPNAVELIGLLRPDIYVKGPDYAEAASDVSGGIKLEHDAVAAAGGRIIFTEDLTFSSSNLLNRYFPAFAPEVITYLDRFKSRHSIKEVDDAIAAMAKLRVTVVGEAIIDEYVYCDQLGKSAKEPVLAMRYISDEKFAGGALAVANHAAAFCESVDLITYIGDRDAHEDFIRRNLKPNVNVHFIVKADSPTILKRRYVENYLLSKLFEVYVINDELLSAAEDDAFCSAIDEIVPQSNLVIAADFGHGLLTPKSVRRLAKKSRFLAVNTQINAANIGFHTISKFDRADYVCIHEGEIRLDARSRRAELRDLVQRLSERLRCDDILVTRGKLGVHVYKSGESYESPAFATKVIDRIGSGDAVLAITSLCAALETPPEITSFIANVIGAQAVQILGNRSSVERVATLKFIDSLLK